MSDILEDVEREYVENFEIVDSTPQIDSMEELLDKIDYQFNPQIEAGIDRTDYFKYYFINVLGLNEKDFPLNCMSIINDDNVDDYLRVIHKIRYGLNSVYGITFDEDNDNMLMNIYNIYYFLVVSPKTLIVDYLLYHNYHKTGYEFNEFFSKNRLNNSLVLPSLVDINPVKVADSLYDQYYNNKEKERYEEVPEDKRFDAFVEYFRAIFGNMEEFNMYEIFGQLNEMSPCDNYEELDIQVKLYGAIRFESMDLIVEKLAEFNTDKLRMRTYIEKELMEPFFSYIDNFDRMIQNSLTL